MKRKIYERLLDWKVSYASKCAVLIEGARRVGKSYIVSEFARREYKHALILDFAKVGSDIKEIFTEKLSNLDEFFMLLQIRTHTTLEKGCSLIVFDEVQRFPRAREAIKYLVADGRYHYIETGSLVSIKKNVEKIVIPSEEMKLRMYPMDFEEFLWAIGHEQVMTLVRDHYERMKPLGATDHRLVMEDFRKYVVIGGMPQAVEAFAAECNLPEAIHAKRMILDLYCDDIEKFAGRLKNKVRAIWKALPSELSHYGRRFSPGAVGSDVRSRELDAPFDWLEESMTVNLAYNVTDPNVGFRLNEDRVACKCYMGDTGLLVTHAFAGGEKASFDIEGRLIADSIGVNKGMLVENVVAQMLRASGCDLHFHFRDDRTDAGNRMEVDFLLTKPVLTRLHNVRPIEVKSNREYTITSLERFREKYRSVAAAPVVLHPNDVKTANGIVYLPLYMTPFLMQ